MTRTLQPSISRMNPQAVSGGLTLAAVLLLAAFQSAQAQTFTVLYNFAGSPDGAHPFAGLVRDASGNLYGTTYTGATSGYGTVFKVDPKGKETVLYSFTGGNDGGSPVGGVVRDSEGNLYGTTQYGGAYENGAVFKVDKRGNETVLYSFQGGFGDGCNPYGGLVETQRVICTAQPRLAALPATEPYSRWRRTATRRCCTASPEVRKTGQILSILP